MKVKRFLAIVMCLAFTAISLFSCKKKEDTSSSVLPDGVYEESGFYLVENAKTDYCILFPKNVTSQEYTAIGELEKLFYEATGIQLEKVSDEAFDANGKYISIGDTVLARENVSTTKELGNAGFQMKTVGDDLVICGKTGTGTLNGVYKLLELIFDFDYFYLDTYHVQTNVKTVPLMLYDFIEIPDVEYNQNTYGWLTDEARNRYRFSTVDRQIEGLVGHNSLKWVPKEHLEAHSKWFNDPVEPNQLCYTAHGDATEYALMLETALNTLKEKLMADNDPAHTRATFAIQDNGSYCKCSACDAELQKYGTNAAALIKFLNALKGKADEWFASEDGKPYARDLTISFYAYLAYKTAPVIKSGDAYVAIDDSVKCVKGVEPRCAYLHADWTVPLTDKKNSESYESFQGWNAVAEEVAFYWYNTNYHYYLAPFNSFNSLQGNYRLARESGVDYVYILSQHTQQGYSTGYNALNAYLSSKLGWDADADVDTLTKKFFKYYFENASDAMYKQFTDWRVWSLHLENDFGNNGYNGVYDEPTNANFNYFPKALLEKWLGYYDEALVAIEPMKSTNQQRYQELYDHIVGERLSTWYLYIELYQKRMPESKALAIKREFKKDFERLGMSRRKEGEGIASLWSDWGI